MKRLLFLTFMLLVCLRGQTQGRYQWQIVVRQVMDEQLQPVNLPTDSSWQIKAFLWDWQTNADIIRELPIRVERQPYASIVGKPPLSLLVSDDDEVVHLADPFHYLDGNDLRLLLVHQKDTMCLQLHDLHLAQPMVMDSLVMMKGLVDVQMGAIINYVKEQGGEPILLKNLHQGVTPFTVQALDFKKDILPARSAERFFSDQSEGPRLTRAIHMLHQKRAGEALAQLDSLPPTQWVGNPALAFLLRVKAMRDLGRPLDALQICQLAQAYVHISQPLWPELCKHAKELHLEMGHGKEASLNSTWGSLNLQDEFRYLVHATYNQMQSAKEYAVVEKRIVSLIDSVGSSLLTLKAPREAQELYAQLAWAEWNQGNREDALDHLLLAAELLQKEQHFTQIRKDILAQCLPSDGWKPRVLAVLDPPHSCCRYPDDDQDFLSEHVPTTEELAQCWEPKLKQLDLAAIGGLDGFALHYYKAIAAAACEQDSLAMEEAQMALALRPDHARCRLLMVYLRMYLRLCPNLRECERELYELIANGLGQ